MELRRWLTRLLHPNLWTTEVLTIASIAGGALAAAHFAMALSAAPPDVIDFDVFYFAVRRWMSGGTLYDFSQSAANYNPPHLHLIMLPLAALPRTPAFVVWTAISVLAALLMLKTAMREADAKWGTKNLRLLSAAMLLSAGTVAAIHVGQVSWIVALLLTYGWQAARHRRWWQAGVWLGVAAGIKPFLLFFIPVLLVRRRWACTATMLAVCLLTVACGAAVFGTDAVRQWIALLSATPPRMQLAFFINASLSALVARVLAPHAIWIGAVGIVAAASIAAARTCDEDRLWLVAITASLLISPLGWIYYLPLLTAPLIVLAVEERLPSWTWIVWPLLVVPPVSQGFMQSNALEALTLGSVYSWGLLFIWIAAVTPLRSPGGDRRVRSAEAIGPEILPGNKDLSR
jgi:hypothetical protein